MTIDPPGVRLATANDADDVALLLHDFNTEFDTPSPGADAQRFYERHGFSWIEPDTGEKAFHVSRELDG